MGLQHRHGVLADLALGQARGGGDLVHEIVDQRGNVLAPLRQRRHPNRYHGKPVVEVLAEATLGDLLFQIARGRRDDADVDSDLVGAALALEGLLDQHAQDLLLGLARHVANLVDEQRAAVGLFQRAGLARMLALDCSTPNSSISIRSGVMAAALITTKGPSARFEAACSVRATSSLPEPAGPTIRMRLLALATRSMVWRS